MLRGVVGLSALAAVLGCGGNAAPATAPEVPPGFRGTIVHVLEDGAYRVDDGAGSACGFADVRVDGSTAVRWRLGDRPAGRDELRVGRRISVWAVGNGETRCRSVTARLVVIEDAPPR